MYSWYDYQWIDSSVHSVSHKELSSHLFSLSRTALLVSALYQHAKHSAGLDDVAAWNGSSVDWLGTNAAKVRQLYMSES